MVIINGQPSEQVSYADRGLQYGDGLFETLAVEAGQPLCWQQHLNRLQDGCERLRIPAREPAQLRDEADLACRGLERGVLKILLTRGTGGRGYRVPGSVRPGCIISSHAWPDYPSSWSTVGIQARYCDARLGINPLLAGIKHTNRLEQVLARMEWSDPDIAEGIMLDTAERVIEGVSSNLFLLRDGVLQTPLLDNCGVQGVMRGEILQAASTLGIPVRECPLSRRELQQAQAMFVCNSVIGIWPIRRLDGLEYAPGEVIQHLQQHLFRHGRVVHG